MFDCPVWEDYGLFNEGVWPQPLTLGNNGSSATEDIFGNIWISYYAGGIVKIPNGDVHNPGAWVSWQAGAIPNATYQIIAADSSGDVWAEGGCGLAIRYDQLSGSWIPYDLFSMGLPCGSNNYMYTIRPNPNNSEVWFCTQAGIAIYDAGNWTIKSQLNGGLPYQGQYYDVVFDSQNNAWIASDSGLIKMTGSSWTVYNTMNSPLITNHINSLAIDSVDNLYISSSTFSFPYAGGLNIFDGGNNWQTFNAYSSPIPHHQLGTVALDKLGNVWLNSLIYGTVIYNFNGVQGFDCMDTTLQMGGVTSVGLVTDPDGHQVSANPNPFTTYTTIRIFQPADGPVSLQIFDVSGKLVKTIEKVKCLKGANSLTLSRDQLASGLYFCKIRTKGSVSIIKLILQ